MQPIIKWVKDRPFLIAFLFIAAAFLGGFLAIQVEAQNRKEDNCFTALETRLVINDIVNFTSGAQVDPSTLPPGTQEFVEQQQAQYAGFKDYVESVLATPPAICDGTDITFDDVREEQPLSPVTTSDPTTTLPSGGG